MINYDEQTKIYVRKVAEHRNRSSSSTNISNTVTARSISSKLVVNGVGDIS